MVLKKVNATHAAKKLRKTPELDGVDAVYAENSIDDDGAKTTKEKGSRRIKGRVHSPTSEVANKTPEAKRHSKENTDCSRRNGCC